MKTSYKDFYDNHYSLLEDDASIVYRTRIEGIRKKLGLSPLCWSDLELFIGQSAGEYNSFDEFHATYIHMQKELENYLLSQQKNFENAINYRNLPIIRTVKEFEASMMDLSTRLDVVESRQLSSKLGPFPSMKEQAIVTLNYTNLVDTLVARSEKIFRHPVHAHGELDDRGLINFGVSNTDQIKNDDIRIDDCKDCWTKEGRNILHGNMRLDNAYRLISDANLLIFYGVSFGLTDSHIWQTISNEMHKRNNLVLLVFDYDLPDKRDPYLWKQQSRKLKNKLTKIMKIENIKNIEERVLVHNSSQVFNFGASMPQLALYPKDSR